MQTTFVKALRILADLPRSLRSKIALFMDCLLCVLSVWLAFSIRLGAWDLVSPSVGLVIAVAIPSWLLAAGFYGVYRAIIRFAGGRTMMDLLAACCLFSIPMIGIFMFVGVLAVPRTIGVLQPMLFFLLLSLSRMAIRYALVDILHVGRPRREGRVAIYGAGSAGRQLGFAIRHDGNADLVCYLDDDTHLDGHNIDGVPIYAASRIEAVVEELGVHEILLAIPSASRARRFEIVERLRAVEVSVRSLPSLANIMEGKVSVRDLREIEVEDLLGRDPVPPDEHLLSGAITGQTVLVSGAGGSIGSELCRQILSRNPRELILVDHSEFALYTIHAELSEQAASQQGLTIIPELADVSELYVARRIMQQHRPHTVFHAAAYKHVPLVEANPIAGLRNNVYGTLNCCLEAEEAGVGRFILVSTDKAVRPTNVMGATKRMCELILQAKAESGGKTLFSMVRFGNVLGSSGSVVPRFRAQIAAGGPITLTHREVTRFFMTVPEAAQLVMQAGAMAKGGEVFVLDMGLPIRIYDLACSMVRLSGLTAKDADNPDGDIEIHEIGLRPGEKMYEELLIGDDPKPTQHVRIMQAHEASLSWAQLAVLLDNLSKALDRFDIKGALAVVRQAVPEYAPPRVDVQVTPEHLGEKTAVKRIHSL